MKNLSANRRKRLAHDPLCDIMYAPIRIQGKTLEDHRASTAGEVERLIDGEWVPLEIMRGVYLAVMINNNKILVHRLVASAFHDIPPSYDVHHVDGNPHNNRLDNLQILSHSQHMRAHSKITDDEMIYLMIMAEQRTLTKIILKKFGISPSHLHACIRGETRKDLSQQRMGALGLDKESYELMTIPCCADGTAYDKGTTDDEYIEVMKMAERRELTRSELRRRKISYSLFCRILDDDYKRHLLRRRLKERGFTIAGYKRLILPLWDGQ